MEMFVTALARIHTDRDVFIRQLTLVPHFGHVVLYDAGDEPWVANIVAETVKWAHPVDFAVPAQNDNPAHMDRGPNTHDFKLIDLHEAAQVEFQVDGTDKCWVNLNGKCLLRVGKVADVVVTDQRKQRK